MSKRYLGEGKSRDFKGKLRKGESFIEEDGAVFAVKNFFCDKCDGCGCRDCKFTGEKHEK